MSTMYVFSDEVPTLNTVATNDIVLLYDTSAGLMKRATVTAVGTVVKALARGSAATSLVGFYGVTAIDQGTMTATNVTALATAVMSAGNAAGVWAWASSTDAAAYVTRMKQAQTDLATFAAKVESTGLLSIAGV